MNRASLAIRYRPQNFAQVVGQETVRTILSRAAAENQVASAYLLSGTRGVGKTTLARIFAKALNCERAPTAEPCNQCEACKRITLGNHVDVVEIDGASNRGIDDARRLRETIGYAPMEGRYKVFIIDEAHMLTRDAFNALLKTLEEPPAGVTFILATTEPHKFPVTIVSRCQHFVFKRLPEAQILGHMINVLGQEGVPYEESALRLIARRAAGSVRDAMSLLGQSLALGEERLTEQGTREVLGLAGQEIFARLLDAFAEQDTLTVATLVREILDQGIDLGFFLRELANLWRTLFMLGQTKGALDAALLDMSTEEMQLWSGYARRFDLAHIHAAWQMVLDGQRRVLNSLEPSASLELLLLHLALLPRLIGLESLNVATSTSAVPISEAIAAPVLSSAPSGAGEEKKKSDAQPLAPRTERTEKVTVTVASVAFSDEGYPDDPDDYPSFDPDVMPAADFVPDYPAEYENDAPPHPAAPRSVLTAPLVSEPVASEPVASEPVQSHAERVSPTPKGAWEHVEQSWQDFYTLCAQSAPVFTHLRSVRLVQQGLRLELECPSHILYQQLSQADRVRELQDHAREYYGKALEIVLKAPSAVHKTDTERRGECEQHPTAQKLKELFGAQLSRVSALPTRVSTLPVSTSALPASTSALPGSSEKA